MEPGADLTELGTLLASLIHFKVKFDNHHPPCVFVQGGHFSLLTTASLSPFCYANNGSSMVLWLAWPSHHW